MPGVTDYTLASKIFCENLGGAKVNLASSIPERAPYSDRFNLTDEFKKSDLIYNLYVDYLATPSARIDRWGMGRGVTTTEPEKCDGMDYLKDPRSPIGKKMVWLFLLCRLGTMAKTSHQKKVIQSKIIEGMSDLLDLLSQTFDEKQFRHPDLILFIFSIELVNQHVYIDYQDNMPGAIKPPIRTYYNFPLQCSLIFWVTSSETVLKKFITLIDKVEPENRTWEMFLNCLFGRKEREKIGFREDTSPIIDYTSQLYSLMKNTPLIVDAQWMFIPDFHQKAFTYLPYYTKEDIYNQIILLPKEELRAFLTDVFLNPNPQEDSLVIFMHKKGRFKEDYDALKYLRKLAVKYLELSIEKTCPIEETYKGMPEDAILKEAKQLKNKENIVQRIKQEPNLEKRFYYLNQALNDKQSLLHRFLTVPRNSINILGNSQIKEIEKEFNRIKPLLPIILTLREPTMSQSMRKLLTYSDRGITSENQQNLRRHMEELGQSPSDKNINRLLDTPTQSIFASLCFWSANKKVVSGNEKEMELSPLLPK